MPTIALDRPWLCAAGVLAAALLLRFCWTRPADLVPSRRRASALLRAVAVLLAALAAAGPHRAEATPRSRVLLAATRSAKAAEGLRPHEGESVRVLEGATAASAVTAALASLPADADARLVLVAADEGEGAGAAVEALRNAVALGIPTFVAPEPMEPPPLPPPAPPPWLLGLRVPAGAVAGVPLMPEPVLAPEAARDAGARLEISVDGGRPATLAPGAPVPPVTLAAGLHVLAASVRDGSGAPRGDWAETFLVRGPPLVLVLEEGAAPSPLVRAMEAQGVPVTRSAPGDLSGLDAAAVVVLGAGASGDAALERAVRNGKGLLAVGARSEARGLGRLRGTPVERALPLFLAPPAPEPPSPPPPDAKPPPGKGPEVREQEGRRPGAVVTLVIVLDTSGSMWGAKIEMARRAAAAAAATLAPEDRFGLLSFAGEPRWEIPPGPAGDSRGIDAALRALGAGGETNLLPALQEARRTLGRETTAVRHCVLLTDGIASPFGLRQAAEGMAGEGTTLSTVGIGEDYDARLLGNLAVWGKGRTFPAVDPSSLPQIVTLDTRRIVEAGREATKKGRPAPDVPPPPDAKKPPDREAPPAPKPPEPPATVALEPADPCAALEGLGPWPPAVPPSAAPAARLATTVALRFAGDHGPALVLGRHGLGRTAALVFDPADVAGWDGFGAAMARLVRSLAPVVPGSPVQAARVRPTAAGTAVRIDVRGDGILPPPRVEALDPRGDSPASVPVLRLAPRSFEVVLPPGLPGFRALAVHAGPPGEPGFPLAIFDPGPAPRPPADPEAPRRLADAAGVPCVPLHAIPPPEPARPGPGRRRPLEWPFLVAAALLLAVDTGLRRAGRAS